MSENDLHELLIKLQDVLREKFSLEEQITTLPENLRNKEEELAVANTAYLAINEQLKKASADAESYAMQYDEAVKTRTDSEKMVETISTQREYEALTKQIDEARVRENGLLKARNAANALVGELELKLDDQTKLCDSLKADIDEEKAKIDGVLASINEQISNLEATCAEIKAQGVSDDIYEKFAKIVKNKNGIGITPIVQGQVCSGCHMILPMQFVNDVRLETSSTQYCPYCSRILYYQEGEDTIDLSGLDSDGSEEELFADSISDEDLL